MRAVKYFLRAKNQKPGLLSLWAFNQHCLKQCILSLISVKIPTIPGYLTLFFIRWGIQNLKYLCLLQTSLMIARKNPIQQTVKQCWLNTLLSPAFTMQYNEFLQRSKQLYCALGQCTFLILMLSKYTFLVPTLRIPSISWFQLLFKM